MNPGAGRVLAAAVPVVALAWLWVASPAPATAVLAATVAMAGAAHGGGRLIGRWLGDDRAPLALVIGWGLAVYLLVGGALARLAVLGEVACHATALLGILGGVTWAIGARDRATPADDRRGRWAPGALAVALATLAIAASAVAATSAGGDRQVVPTYLVALTADLARTIALPIGPGLAEDGWSFALVLALVLTATAPATPLARVLAILAVASAPTVIVGGVRWTSAACALVIALTVTRPCRSRRAWPVVVGLVAAIAIDVTGDVAASLIGAALGAAGWTLAWALADDEGATAAVLGKLSPRVLAVTVAALIGVLAVAGARVPLSRATGSWQSRLEGQVDAAAMLFDARRATAFGP